MRTQRNRLGGAHGVFLQLAVSDPTNSTSQRNLAIGHGGLTALHWACDEKELAVEYANGALTAWLDQLAMAPGRSTHFGEASAVVAAMEQLGETNLVWAKDRVVEILAPLPELAKEQAALLEWARKPDSD